MSRPNYAQGAVQRRTSSESHALKENITIPSRIKTFFNSALGLWVLSTCFISFGSWSYTNWTQNLKTEAIRTALIKRLDQEIEHRISLADWRRPLGLRRYRPLKQNELNGLLSSLPEKLLFQPTEKNELYPEYSKRTLQSLLIELNDLLPFDEATCVQDALYEVEKFSDRWLTTPPHSLVDYRALTRDLDNIADARWSSHAKLASTQLILTKVIDKPIRGVDRYLCGSARQLMRANGQIKDAF